MNKVIPFHPNAIGIAPYIVSEDKPLDGSHNIFCFVAFVDKNARVMKKHLQNKILSKLQKAVQLLSSTETYYSVERV